jgi:hypothetical protein
MPQVPGFETSGLYKLREPDSEALTAKPHLPFATDKVEAPATFGKPKLIRAVDFIQIISIKKMHDWSVKWLRSMKALRNRAPLGGA